MMSKRIEDIDYPGTTLAITTWPVADRPADCTISLGSCRAACSISLTILGVVCVNIPVSGSVRQVEVSGIMSRIKFAALILLAFACLCSISVAQEQQPPDTLANLPLRSISSWPSRQTRTLQLTSRYQPATLTVTSTSAPSPSPRAVTGPDDIRPFRSVAIGFKADTLGAGFEIATPMSRRLQSPHQLSTSSPSMIGFNIDGAQLQRQAPSQIQRDHY